jgi:hypothetical protein
MNRTTSFFRASLLALFALWVLPGQSFAQAPRSGLAALPDSGPVEALIYSTMPSTAAHRPEMAMDGDSQSYFRSVYGMDSGDDFTILLSRAIPVQSLQVTTGDTDGQDTLTRGILETSPDTVHYSQAATFDRAGVATASGQRLVQAIRIRLRQGQGVPALLVREITMNSPVKIARVLLGPGRGFVDISQAPDLAVWSQTAEKQMEESWADTAALLYSDKFISPNMVNVIYTTGPGVTAIAATGGGVMTVNAVWPRAHPEDTALTVHETAHVIQAYSSYNPVWLVEGIADYIRWTRFEPEHFHPRINVQTATYHDSYQTSATFLRWCELHYDSRLVTKLSQDVRFGAYQDSLFNTYCGKDVNTLWAEFIAAYKADPVNIITPPVAAADRPRVLPAVAAGSGVPVDLSAAFNTSGIASDNAKFSPTAGLDNGGVAYSSKLLGPRLTWKGVPFQFGPANAADAISCKGENIALPTGQYTGLWLLGAAVNGAQPGQTLIVTYTDGTTDTLAQNFSDWFQPDGVPGESRAVKMSYRNMATAEKDARTFYAYSYGFPLDSKKTVKSLTLPDNDSVKILAVTLTK